MLESPTASRLNDDAVSAGDFQDATRLLRLPFAFAAAYGLDAQSVTARRS